MALHLTIGALGVAAAIGIPVAIAFHQSNENAALSAEIAAQGILLQHQNYANLQRRFSEIQGAETNDRKQLESKLSQLQEFLQEVGPQRSTTTHTETVELFSRLEELISTLSRQVREIADAESILEQENLEKEALRQEALRRERELEEERKRIEAANRSLLSNEISCMDNLCTRWIIP